MFTTRNPCQIGPEQRSFGQVFEFYSWGHGTRDELVAIYRAADLALIAFLKDGMNLVSKEYCAATTEVNGVLVLIEFAGAAPELRVGAILVNLDDEVGWFRAPSPSRMVVAGKSDNPGCMQLQRDRLFTQAGKVKPYQCDLIGRG